MARRAGHLAVVLRSRFDRRLGFESLEDRRLLSVDLVSKAAIPSGTASGDSFVYTNSISANGRYVAFTSSASNVVSGIAVSPGVQNVYRFDRVTGDVELVSINSAGTGSGNASSNDAVISADGSVVAFTSIATNLSPLDTNSSRDVYARNLTTNTTYLVSVNSTGTGGGNGTSSGQVISADGNVVAFTSLATNLSPFNTHSIVDVYARNLSTGTTYLVSINSMGTGSGNGVSSVPVISADGKVVAFSSSATNLSPLATTVHNFHIYARNLATNTTYLVDVSSAGTTGGNGYGAGGYVISADGNVVAFHSDATNLSPLDTNSNVRRIRGI